MAWGVLQLVARVHLSHTTRKTDEPVTKLCKHVHIGHKVDTSAGFLPGPVTRGAREPLRRQTFADNPLCF